MFCLLGATCWFSFVYIRVKGNRLIHWEKNKLSDKTKRTECDRICDKVVCAFYIVSFPMSTSLEILEEKLKTIYKHLQTGGNEAWWPRPCLFFAPHSRQRWAMRVNFEDISTGEPSGLFQPDGIDDGPNNPYLTNLHHPVNHLRNPEGERPTSNSTTVQSECRG